MSAQRSPLTYILFGKLSILLSQSTSHIQAASLPSAILLFNKKNKLSASFAFAKNDNDLSRPAGFLTRRIHICLFPSPTLNFSILPKAAFTLSAALQAVSKHSFLSLPSSK